MASEDSLGVLPLVRLLQLASPALPVGAYSYSQGLEWAVDSRMVRDAASAQSWIGDLLTLVMARGEAPMLSRLLESAGGDWMTFIHWNERFRVSRETSELRAETEQMGQSLLTLIMHLELLDAKTRDIVPALRPITLPAVYALAARGFELPDDAALTAYLWSWLENQVMAAIRLVPLGQVAGQKMLVTLSARIPVVVEAARNLADDDISTFAPGLALASARHETQYTRLFRS